MEKKYNLGSFFLCLFLLALSLYSLYVSINQIWSIAPPVSVLWLMTVCTFILGIVGFKDKTSKRAKVRSWLTVLISFSLSAFLLLGIAVTTIMREPIETTQSPDSKYTIDFYTVNGGAASSISVLGVIDGPLWFKKNIYKHNNMHQVNIEWNSNYIVTINNLTLNLYKGEIFPK
ncbi:DUF5412 family protein [Paraliobacillus sediminis]|uniref:DUF5412 family protein n=1 Tax=Paraliobacillus sediminis TaxID=1885916 RepID=UPI001F08272F|nr:DUF5412 family protein [Paraliobacillus sediminis]